MRVAICHSRHCAPDSEPLFRLFFDAYALALRRPPTFATLVLAGFRGFLLDFCATRDRRRIDRAVDLWLQAIDRIPLPSSGASDG
jgi:hypothetical protein